MVCKVFCPVLWPLWGGFSSVHNWPSTARSHITPTDRKRCFAVAELKESKVITGIILICNQTLTEVRRTRILTPARLKFTLFLFLQNSEQMIRQAFAALAKEPMNKRQNVIPANAGIQKCEGTGHRLLPV
jgi:hypothetical protein